MKRFVLFAVILVCISSLLCACGQSSQGIGEAGISLDEFNQLSLNMSYYRVCEIIGGKGELISESEIDESDRTVYVSTYRFEGENAGYAELEITVYGYKDLAKLDLKDYLTGKTNYNLE